MVDFKDSIVNTFHLEPAKQDKPFEEGDICISCHTGILFVGPVQNCSCHLGHAPCGSCTNNPLVCSDCGEEYL